MRKQLSKILLFILLLTLAFQTKAFAAIGIEDKVGSYIIGDSATGQIFASHNAEKEVPIASLTKLMAFMVAEDAIAAGEIKSEDEIVISKKIEEVSGSSMGLKEGEKVTVGDVEDGMIVVSANDGAIALAEKVGGTEQAFVDRMDKKAREIGLSTAKFHNASGLPIGNTENTMSTAELFKMTVYLLEHYPRVLEISNTNTLVQPKRNFSEPSTVPFIGTIAGVDGLKTGTTDKAGNCLITTLKGAGNQGKEEFRTIGISMGAKDKQIRNDSMRELLYFVQNNFAVTQIVDSEKVYDTVELSSSKAGEIQIYPSEELKMIINKDKGVSYKAELLDVKAPLKKGDKVGELLVEPGGNAIRKIDLIVKEDYEAADPGTRVLRSTQNMFSLFKSMLYF